MTACSELEHALRRHTDSIDALCVTLEAQRDAVSQMALEDDVARTALTVINTALARYRSVYDAMLEASEHAIESSTLSRMISETEGGVPVSDSIVLALVAPTSVNECSSEAPAADFYAARKNPLLVARVAAARSLSDRWGFLNPEKGVVDPVDPIKPGGMRWGDTDSAVWAQAFRLWIVRASQGAKTKHVVILGSYQFVQVAKSAVAGMDDVRLSAPYIKMDVEEEIATIQARLSQVRNNPPQTEPSPESAPEEPSNVVPLNAPTAAPDPPPEPEEVPERLFDRLKDAKDAWCEVSGEKSLRCTRHEDGESWMATDGSVVFSVEEEDDKERWTFQPQPTGLGVRVLMQDMRRSADSRDHEVLILFDEIISAFQELSPMKLGFKMGLLYQTLLDRMDTKNIELAQKIEQLLS